MPQGHRVSPVREVGRGFFERAPVLDHNNLDASFVATSTADHRAARIAAAPSQPP